MADLVQALGLMSGTSMDGIDAAVIASDGEYAVNTLDYQQLAYEPCFQLGLKSIEFATRHHQGQLAKAKQNYQPLLDCYLSEQLQLSPQQRAHFKQDLANYLYGDKQQLIQFEDIVKQSTKLHQQLAQRVFKPQVQTIGYHGQTLYHNPKQRISLQVGYADMLCQQFKVPVISDFRRNDIEHGGQGAPLAPIYHLALAIRDQRLPCVIVNCGGISNVTVIPTASPHSLHAFDCGPGNALLDQYVKCKTQGEQAMDRDGQFARAGTVNQALLDQLRQYSCWQNRKNFYDLPPPKSLDIGELQLIPELFDHNINDACATLAAFTAECIVDSVCQLAISEIPRQWILAGGGFNNPSITHYLHQWLSQHGEFTLTQADAINWHGQALEAQLIAYLAIRHQQDKPISFPSTTGVKQAVSGGILTERFGASH